MFQPDDDSLPTDQMCVTDDADDHATCPDNAPLPISRPRLTPKERDVLRNHKAGLLVDEETILLRLEALQKGLALPREVWNLLVEILCPESKQLVAGLEDEELPLPPRPTRHPPGTEGRLVVMAWRTEHGYALWHPDDARLDTGAADTDRLAIAGHNSRNGQPLRRQAAVVERRYDRDPADGTWKVGDFPVARSVPGHPGTPPEGFLLLAGKVEPRKKRRKKKGGGGYNSPWTQLELFPLKDAA